MAGRIGFIVLLDIAKQHTIYRHYSAFIHLGNRATESQKGLKARNTIRYDYPGWFPAEL